MVIAGDRQHMVAINDPNYLKYMMCFDANGAHAWTVKRTTGIQPVASNVERRTVASSKVLPHPPAAPLNRRSLESAPTGPDPAATSGVAVRQVIPQPAHA